MKPNSFMQQAQLIQLQGFKAKLKTLRKSYAEVQKKFNNLCDEIDTQKINEAYLQEISSRLSIYSSEIDLISQKIKEILEIIEHLKAELSN